MKELCGCTLKELQELLVERGEKPFRAQQIFEWVYRKGVSSFEAMSNMSKDLRVELASVLKFPALRLIHTQHAEETTKFLWELADGLRVESVLISSFDRRTVCVSSQVGCPARCAFCASGREGLLRSLSTAEIVEQVLHIDRFLAEKQERVSHIVYMGMGEPLENYDAVVQSIRLLNDEHTLNISQRRMTVSTVGVVEGIRRFSKEGLQATLVLSLHAPSQQLRKKIIPYARKYPLDEVLLAMDEYVKVTKRETTFEYTMLSGINDSESTARELATLLSGKSCTVNLIPYNPVAGIRIERPKLSQVVRFREVLEQAGIRVTWRYTKGEDIAAACGQLALQKADCAPASCAPDACATSTC